MKILTHVVLATFLMLLVVGATHRSSYEIVGYDTDVFTDHDL